MSRVTSYYSIPVLNRVFPPIVAIIAFVWFVIRVAYYVLPTLLSVIYSVVYYPLSIIMTGLIIIFSAMDYERRSVVGLLVTISIALLLDYFLIVSLSFSYFLIAFEPFLIAIVIFSSIALGFELNGILKLRISSGIIALVIPLLFVAIGSIGLMMELPGIISFLLYSGSESMINIGIIITIQNMLFFLIYVGSAAIEFTRTTLYWVIFIACGVSLIIFNILSLNMFVLFAYLNLVLAIAFRFFGVAAAIMNQPVQRYGTELGETEDPFKHLE